jgi:glucoamylase
MSRDLPIGNGSLLIAFDKDFILKEFYFPHVGEENHAGEHFCLGVFADNRMAWVPDGWQIHRDYFGDTLVTDVALIHEEFGLKIISQDLVDFEENIYLKKLIVENLQDKKREVRLMLCQDFEISGNDIGDTAAFKPENNSLLHYKGERYFLINIWANHKFGIDDFATGNHDVWKDAEDGILSSNPIAQGSVSSVLAIPLLLEPRAKEICYYWICIGKNWEEVSALNLIVKKKSPEEIFRRTGDFWKLWVDKERQNYELLPEKVGWAYRRSLLICRTQINNCGSIIAANDSDAIRFNRDTYSYMWPRDGALVSYALTLAGYDSENFFRFCGDIIEKDGYFLHKYSPTGSLGSSWHPWLTQHKAQLPIQEDETALVIWSLWHHYRQFKNLELIRTLYDPLIKKAADFMMNYRDPKTGLPLHSFDLWEERQGILTFTVSAVFGGLMAASYFAKEFGEADLAKDYAEGASKMQAAMDKYLYLPNLKRFARMAEFRRDGSIEHDASIDASLYGIFAFGAYPPDDPKVKSTMEQVFSSLEVNGGISRYENDPYYRQGGQSQSNPWFIATLWKAQYLIALAKTEEELKGGLDLLEWIADRAMPSGVMAEQMHPETLEPLSVSPLTWSHATFIAAVQEYLNRLIEIHSCPTCGRPKLSKTRIIN